jgi:hypothetical protein
LVAERGEEGRREVQWRAAMAPLYIGAEGEAVAGDLDGETTGDKWGRKWLNLRVV